MAALLTSLIYVSTNKSCYQGVTGHFTGFCTDNGYCMYCNKYSYGLVFRREIVTRVSMKFLWRRVSSLYCLPFCYQGITEILVAAKYDTMVFYVGISTKVLRSPLLVSRTTIIAHAMYSAICMIVENSMRQVYWC